MNWRDYDKTTAKQLCGRKARTTRALRNGYAEIPAGTVVTITGKLGGLAIETEKCRSCGVRVFVNRVEPDAVILL